MAETRISRIQVRRGDIADLPILQEGEIGYALDEHRMFIGNRELAVGTGDGTSVTFDNPFIHDLPRTSESVADAVLYVDGVETNAVVTVDDITFTTPPALGADITLKVNTEIAMVNRVLRPGSKTLGASQATAADSGFAFDATRYDTAFVNYTINAATKFRSGTLRILVDTVNNNVIVDDQYSRSPAMQDIDVTFSGVIDLYNNAQLQYTNNETVNVTLKYTFELWKM